MKTIKILILALLLSVTACKKSEKSSQEPEAEQTHYIAFGGTLSSNGHVYINNVEKTLNVIYEVKKGDVAKFTDTGNDIIHPPGYVINTPNGPITSVGPYTEQGYTHGSIVFDGGTVVAHYEGNGDCNISYKVN